MFVTEQIAPAEEYRNTHQFLYVIWVRVPFVSVGIKPHLHVSMDCNESFHVTGVFEDEISDGLRFWFGESSGASIRILAAVRRCTRTYEWHLMPYGSRRQRQAYLRKSGRSSCSSRHHRNILGMEPDGGSFSTCGPKNVDLGELDTRGNQPYRCVGVLVAVDIQDWHDVPVELVHIALDLGIRSVSGHELQ